MIVIKLTLELASLKVFLYIKYLDPLFKGFNKEQSKRRSKSPMISQRNKLNSKNQYSTNNNNNNLQFSPNLANSAQITNNNNNNLHFSQNWANSTQIPMSNYGFSHTGYIGYGQSAVLGNSNPVQNFNFQNDGSAFIYSGSNTSTFDSFNKF